MTATIPTECPKCHGEILIMEAEDYHCDRIWCFHCGWDSYIQKRGEIMETPSAEVTKDVHLSVRNADNEKTRDFMPTASERTPNTLFDLIVDWVELPALNRTPIQWLQHITINQATFRVSGYLTKQEEPRFFVTVIVPVAGVPQGMLSREANALCKALYPLITEHTGAKVAQFGGSKVDLEWVAA